VQHRLSNPGTRRLKLIEIGYGEALGDEDTVRLPD
jgi:mannose-6-phosphate isomerase-like protein (cupin superfamily)